MSKRDKDVPQYKGSELIRAETGVNKDILTATLKPNKLYTAEQANSLREKFINKEVDIHGSKLDSTK